MFTVTCHDAHHMARPLQRLRNSLAAEFASGSGLGHATLTRRILLNCKFSAAALCPLSLRLSPDLPQLPPYFYHEEQSVLVDKRHSLSETKQIFVTVL